MVSKDSRRIRLSQKLKLQESLVRMSRDKERDSDLRQHAMEMAVVIQAEIRRDYAPDLPEEPLAYELGIGKVYKLAGL